MFCFLIIKGFFNLGFSTESGNDCGAVAIVALGGFCFVSESFFSFLFFLIYELFLVRIAAVGSMTALGFADVFGEDI